MKIFIIMFALCVYFSGMVYGQDNRSKTADPFTIALDGGMTLSKLSNEGFNILGDLYGGMELSYMPGAELEYAITPAVRVRSGVKYVRLGGKSEETVQTDTEGRELNRIRIVNKQSNIEIPLLLKYVFTGDWYQPYIESGATIGFLTSASLVADGTLNGETLTIDEDISDVLKDTAVGLNFSVGVQIPLRAALGLDIGGTYNLGLTNQLDAADEDRSQKVRSWRFELGLFLGI
ncbi:MAG: outer membrane beta-barrel protein [Calditrichia bacterium]